MLRLRNCLLAVPALAGLTAPAPVSAALINWEFEPGSSACFFEFPPGLTCPKSMLVLIKGSFTFDTNNVMGELPKVDITLSQVPFPAGSDSVTLMKGSSAGLETIKADNTGMAPDPMHETSVTLDFDH